MRKVLTASAVISILCLACYILAENAENSNWAYYFQALFGTLVFFPASLILLIISLAKNKYWNTTFFLVCAFANLMISVFCFATGEVTTIALFSLPFIVGIAMVVVFWRKSA